MDVATGIVGGTWVPDAIRLGIAFLGAFLIALPLWKYVRSQPWAQPETMLISVGFLLVALALAKEFGLTMKKGDSEVSLEIRAQIESAVRDLEAATAAARRAEAAVVAASQNLEEVRLAFERQPGGGGIAVRPAAIPDPADQYVPSAVIELKIQGVDHIDPTKLGTATEDGPKPRPRPTSVVIPMRPVPDAVAPPGLPAAGPPTGAVSSPALGAE